MSPSVEEILGLEKRVWEALKTGDAALDAEMLTEDFLGVYPSGFSTKQQHCDQLKNGPTVATYELRDARLSILSVGLVLLSYLALWSRVKKSEAPVSEKMYISSIWRLDGREWKNSFSQDTPA